VFLAMSLVVLLATSFCTAQRCVGDRDVLQRLDARHRHQVRSARTALQVLVRHTLFVAGAGVLPPYRYNVDRVWCDGRYPHRPGSTPAHAWLRGLTFYPDASSSANAFDSAGSLPLEKVSRCTPKLFLATRLYILLCYALVGWSLRWFFFALPLSGSPSVLTPCTDANSAARAVAPTLIAVGSPLS
jgi:hypothetical protein